MEIKVIRNVLDANNAAAQRNRKLFSDKKIFVLNMMSSPGSGKTATLQRTLSMLMPEIKAAVIVGDICTSNDADRLAKTGAPVIQINTGDLNGGDCHLAAHTIADAAQNLDLDELDILIIENVGNLVCPADFDLGEDARAVVLSVTEGEDKPLKYPLMFRVCEVAIINKIDLLPHLDFDLNAAVANIFQIHPDKLLFQLSAKTGEGFDAWIAWLKSKVKSSK